EFASTENKVKVPSCTNLPLRNALTLLTEQNLRVVVSGNGQVVKQVPPPGKMVARGQTVKLICEATI
ncbi:MAG: PASTA domain-containing protein, partial [Calditrichaeota bacterium]